MKSTDPKKKKKMMKPQQIHLKKIEKARQKTRGATQTDIPILSQKLQFLLKLCVGICIEIQKQSSSFAGLRHLIPTKRIGERIRKKQKNSMISNTRDDTASEDGIRKPLLPTRSWYRSSSRLPSMLGSSANIMGEHVSIYLCVSIVTLGSIQFGFTVN